MTSRNSVVAGVKFVLLQTVEVAGFLVDSIRLLRPQVLGQLKRADLVIAEPGWAHLETARALHFAGQLSTEFSLVLCRKRLMERWTAYGALGSDVSVRIRSRWTVRLYTRFTCSARLIILNSSEINVIRRRVQTPQFVSRCSKARVAQIVHNVDSTPASHRLSAGIVNLVLAEQPNTKIGWQFFPVTRVLEVEREWPGDGPIRVLVVGQRCVDSGAVDKLLAAGGRAGLEFDLRVIGASREAIATEAVGSWTQSRSKLFVSEPDLILAIRGSDVLLAPLAAGGYGAQKVSGVRQISASYLRPMIVENALGLKWGLPSSSFLPLEDLENLSSREEASRRVRSCALELCRLRESKLRANADLVANLMLPP